MKFWKGSAFIILYNVFQWFFFNFEWFAMSMTGIEKGENQIYGRLFVGVTWT